MLRSRRVAHWQCLLPWSVTDGNLDWAWDKELLGKDLIY